jgi:hypothetical protein
MNQAEIFKKKKVSCDCGAVHGTTEFQLTPRNVKTALGMPVGNGMLIPCYQLAGQFFIDGTSYICSKCGTPAWSK